MAGLEADTSGYASQPLPVSPLDMTKNIAATRSAVQQNISNDTKITADKLSLMAQQFGMMNNELANLIDSGATKPQAAERLQRIAKTLNLPPEASNHMMEELNQAPDVKTFAQFAIRRGMDTMQKYGVQLGTNETQNDGANIVQGVRASPEYGGGFKATTRMPVQQPPGTPTVNNNPNDPNYLQPTYLGSAGPSGVVPVGPNAAPAVPMPRPAPGSRPMPVAPPPAVSGPIGPTVQTGHDFAQRFAGDGRGALPVGAPPGVAGAMANVAEQSGKDFSTALQKAGNIQAELQPDLAVLDIVKGKAPGDFGPGTDGFNKLKKVAVTWLPNVDAKLIEDSKDFDTVKKYLVQGARGAGNTGTNDQLAAAFEGSPNVTMNTATIESIVKTRVALKKMEAAQALLANQQGVPAHEFSKWKAKNQNVLDPRAFGWDMMSDEARQKLVKRLTPKEYQKLETSVQFAKDAELIEPPVRK